MNRRPNNGYRNFNRPSGRTADHRPAFQTNSTGWRNSNPRSNQSNGSANHVPIGKYNAPLESRENGIVAAESNEPKPVKKPSRMGRLILRNLPFKITEKDLKDWMGKCGNIVDVRIPKKADGHVRGFGFVEFKSIHAAETAVNMFNGKELNGRTVAVDWAVAKSRYDEAKAKQAEAVKAEADDAAASNDDEADIKQEEDSSDGDDERSGSEDESDGAKSDDDENPKDSDAEGENGQDSDNEDGKKTRWPKKPADVDEGRTLFIRNLPFTLEENELKESFAPYGRVLYARICCDKDSGHSKGTGFVKFVKREDAESALKESESTDAGVVINDRKLLLCLAESTKQRRKEERNAKEKPVKDNRNLYLMKASHVSPKDDAHPPMSKNDERKRQMLDKKKTAALKNLHMFISTTRLTIHNLPKSVDDKKLRQLCCTSAGINKRSIKECRVMRDKKMAGNLKTAKSLGFGFVEFATHEEAIKVLEQLNNNPTVFTDEKRPIVEFALENKLALQKKQKRLEHSQAKMKALKAKNPEITEKKSPKPSSAKPKDAGIKKATKPTGTNEGPKTKAVTKSKPEKPIKEMSPTVSSSTGPQVDASEAPAKKKKTNKRKRPDEKEDDTFSQMVKQYKKKIESNFDSESHNKGNTRWFDE